MIFADISFCLLTQFWFEPCQLSDLIWDGLFFFSFFDFFPGVLLCYSSADLHPWKSSFCSWKRAPFLEGFARGGRSEDGRSSGSLFFALRGHLKLEYDRAQMQTTALDILSIDRTRYRGCMGR